MQTPWGQPTDACQSFVQCCSSKHSTDTTTEFGQRLHKEIHASPELEAANLEEKKRPQSVRRNGSDSTSLTAVVNWVTVPGQGAGPPLHNTAITTPNSDNSMNIINDIRSRSSSCYSCVWDLVAVH